ncbi:MAG: hypothetical protein AAFV45_15430 [Pseudomonadota bacterium]
MPADKQTSEQSKRFVEAAREAGCDEGEDAFERKLKKLATARPAKEKKDEDKPK